MRLEGRRVLVTGGAGVIARELLELLADAGATTLSVDRLPLPGPVPPGVTHLQGDLALMDLGAIADFDPEIVLHLAATFERSVESAEYWEPNWSDNVVVTHRLAELAGRTGRVRSFVFASSYLVYHTAQYLALEPPARGVALAEEAALQPRNLCGAAKLYGEAELEFARSVLGGGARTVAARIFRVYGRGSRDVVSRWVRAALRGEQIDVYHAENRFDYVYSRDVAEGLLRMAVEPGAAGPINLATGTDRTVGAVLVAIRDATGIDLRVSHRPADEPYEGSRADVTRLRERLGWTPGTRLEDGVARLVAHEQASLRDA